MRCIIGGCIKNCENYIITVFNNIKKIQNLFDDTVIILSYDISSDNSAGLLRYLRKEFNNLIIIINYDKIDNFRTIKIANARNKILDLINEKYNDYDYLIMLDCDDVCSLDIDIDILKASLSRNDWDALSFNREGYYDIWALSINPYVYSCWHWGNNCLRVVEKMREYIIDKLKNIKNDELLECFSAFNGFAIYRIDKIKNCRYNGYLNNNLFNQNLIDENKRILNLDIVYRPDDCEHRNFHMEMINKNDARIMISPLYLFK